MATKFHFFTDTNLLLAQPSSDAFGPAGTDDAGNDQYRISSMHSASSNPTAYAICNGIVCAQDIPNTSPALVNLILKPLDRPPINFVPVRYYIYKGIRKDSLINGAAIAASGTNDLTKAIWDSQNAKNQSANTPGVPAPAEALGIDLTAAFDATKYGDTQSIDNLYFRTGVDAQFPVVKGGWSIATFDNTRFGFAILLEGMGLHHNLAIVRTLDDHILVASLTGAETLDQVFAHWHEKENVLGFMDPCAFYGSFYGSSIRAKTSTGSFDVKKQASLYNEVVALFFNKNRAYVDIRNEHNYSFDYFNNYGRQLEIAFDATSARSQYDYYATGWPIQIIAGTQFPINNSKSVNVLRLALPAGDNSRPLLYISQGYKSKGAASFPRDLSSADKFARVNLQGAVTDEVALAFPNVASSTNAQPVAFYTRLKYFKRIDSSQTVTSGSPATVVSANYLDNIFSLDMKTTLGGASPIKSVVHDEEIYVDATAQLGIEFLGKVGFAADSNNVTFFAFPVVVISGDENGKSTPFTITADAYNGGDTYLNLLVRRFAPKRIEKSTIVLSTTSASNPNTIFVTGDAETDGKFASPNFDNFIGLVFGNAAYQELVVLAANSFLPNYRVYLGIKDIAIQTDTAGVAYTSYEIILRGYVLANGRVEVKEQKTDAASVPAYSSNIKVYSQ